MLYSFFRSKNTFFKAWGGGIVILAALIYQTQILVSINEWYAEFYNILQSPQKYSLERFWDEIFVFAQYAGIYVLLASFSNWMTKYWALWWREDLTFKFLELFRNNSVEVEGSSQRIQEDIYRYTRIIQTLGLTFTRSILILISFLPILYGLSSHVEIPFLRDIEGSLVYVALFLSTFALVGSLIIGHFLPKLEFNNSVVEAKFRKHLVYGESSEQREEFTRPHDMIELFTGLKFNYRKLFNHYGYFDLWINTFEQAMVIVPYLIMAPSLFSGSILLGVLIQLSNSFSKVRESMNFLVNNFDSLVEFLAIRRRLNEFEIELRK